MADKKWYVVHAYSNFEHKVSESLKERIRLKNLAERFGEILVPTEEVVEMRDGQRRKSERKFFPGYVLVQMEMDEDTWHLVRETPKVEVILREDYTSPLNPLGIKGAGESGITGVGAAIASAIDDAIGMPGAVTQLPVTPQRLKQILNGRR